MKEWTDQPKWANRRETRNRKPREGDGQRDLPNLKGERYDEMVMNGRMEGFGMKRSSRRRRRRRRRERVQDVMRA